MCIYLHWSFCINIPPGVWLREIPMSKRPSGRLEWYTIGMNGFQMYSFQAMQSRKLEATQVFCLSFTTLPKYFLYLHFSHRSVKCAQDWDSILKPFLNLEFLSLLFPFGALVLVQRLPMHHRAVLNCYEQLPALNLKMHYCGPHLYNVQTIPSLNTGLYCQLCFK